MVTEIFRQGPRAAAMGFAQAINWICNLVLMWTFIFIQVCNFKIRHDGVDYKNINIKLKQLSVVRVYVCHELSIKSDTNTTFFELKVCVNFHLRRFGEKIRVVC